MSEDKQKIIVITSGVFLIVILLFVVILQTKLEDKKVKPSTFVPSYSQKDEMGSDVEIEMPQWQENEFRKPVPTGVSVPAKGEVIPEELKDVVAVPFDFLPPRSGKASDPGIGRFEIKAEGNKFIPSQVIVRYNDIVDIDVEAIDKDYDLILEGYSMRQSIRQGERSKLSFQANQEGRFKFYCNSCGGPESGATGEIVVVR